MKTLWSGIAVAFLLLLLGIFTPYHSAILTIAFSIAVVCLILAGMFVGALISGDRNRANVASESKEDSNNRLKTGWLFFSFGIPQLVVCILLFFIFP
ncbi:MAG: DUF5316 domain-containing protein [Sporolactobacillus sp.]